MTGSVIHKIPFVRFLGALIPGMLVANYFSYFVDLFLVLCALGLCGLLLSGRYNRIKTSYRLRWINGVSVYLILFALGYFVFIRHDSHVKSLPVETQRYYATIQDEPVVKENSVFARLVVDGSGISSRKAIVYLEKDSASINLHYGDRIIFEAGFDSIAKTGVPKGFDYAAWMYRQHIVSQAYLRTNTWMLAGEKDSWDLSDIRHEARIHIHTVFSKYIDDKGLGLLMALLVGEKRHIDRDQKQVFKVAGVLHVLAVSGLHVGIMYVFMSGLLFFMKRNKYVLFLRSMLIWIALIGFSIIAGLSPSVVRAAGMFILIDVGRLLNKKGSIYNIIAASAFISLLSDPHTLFEAGFWLSYSAVLSIISFFPYVKQLWNPANVILRKLRDLLALSISVQPGTAPLSIFLFNQFPTLFLLSNIVAVPMVGLIINLSMLILLLEALSIPYAGFCFILQHMFNMLDVSIQWIAGLPGSLIAGLSISKIGLLLLALSAFLLARLLWTKDKRLIWYCGAAFVCFQAFHLYRTVINMSQSQLIVFENFQKKGVYLKSGEIGTWIVNPDEENKYNILESYKASVGINKEFNYLNHQHEQEATDIFNTPNIYLQCHDTISFRNIMNLTTEERVFKRIRAALRKLDINREIELVIIPGHAKKSQQVLIFNNDYPSYAWLADNDGITFIDLAQNGPLYLNIYKHIPK